MQNPALDAYVSPTWYRSPCRDRVWILHSELSWLPFRSWRLEGSWLFGAPGPRSSSWPCSLPAQLVLVLARSRP